MNYTFVIADNQALTRCGLRRLINTVTVEAAIVEVSEKNTHRHPFINRGQCRRCRYS